MVETVSRRLMGDWDKHLKTEGIVAGPGQRHPRVSVPKHVCVDTEHTRARNKRNQQRHRERLRKEEDVMATRVEEVQQSVNRSRHRWRELRQLRHSLLLQRLACSSDTPPAPPHSATPAFTGPAPHPPISAIPCPPVPASTWQGKSEGALQPTAAADSGFVLGVSTTDSASEVSNHNPSMFSPADAGQSVWVQMDAQGYEAYTGFSPAQGCSTTVMKGPNRFARGFFGTEKAAPRWHSKRHHRAVITWDQLLPFFEKYNALGQRDSVMAKAVEECQLVVCQQLGASPHDVEFDVALPYTTRCEEQLCVSPSPSTLSQSIASMLSLCLYSFESMMLVREHESLQAAQSHTYQPPVHRYMEPCNMQHPPAPDHQLLAKLHISMVEATTYPAEQAVEEMFGGILRKYRALLPHDMWMSLCMHKFHVMEETLTCVERSLVAMEATSEQAGGQCDAPQDLAAEEHASDLESCNEHGGTDVELVFKGCAAAATTPQQMAPTLGLQRAMQAVLRVGLRVLHRMMHEKVQPTGGEKEGSGVEGRTLQQVLCRMLEVTGSTNAALANSLLSRPLSARRNILRTALAPGMATAHQQRMTMRVYALLKLTVRQKQLLAERWRRWGARRSSLTLQLASALHTLDRNLPSLQCPKFSALLQAVEATCSLGDSQEQQPVAPTPPELQAVARLLCNDVFAYPLLDCCSDAGGSNVDTDEFEGTTPAGMGAVLPTKKEGSVQSLASMQSFTVHPLGLSTAASAQSTQQQCELHRYVSDPQTHLKRRNSQRARQLSSVRLLGSDIGALKRVQVSMQEVVDVHKTDELMFFETIAPFSELDEVQHAQLIAANVEVGCPESLIMMLSQIAARDLATQALFGSATQALFGSAHAS